MTATIIPFPEREIEFAEPCSDPASCLSVIELQGTDTLTAVCPRCGLVGHLDATLAELDEAVEAAEASS
ncbi:hypothetical protein OKC48_06920 [Methylorubrum extorquens]|uniref:hypothetical protein n=1 Tax=Methylorubrum extorquens TaxID=408 RepID=UPI0022384838|nr:hypothetical protein [Methylorubrum extorquens]UYW28246.1 hypothetical protein OKC48_06920 [Methylorubrum extorquens]